MPAGRLPWPPQVTEMSSAAGWGSKLSLTPFRVRKFRSQVVSALAAGPEGPSSVWQQAGEGDTASR